MAVTTTEPKFNCSTCGKEYRWKPELAGKKAKCKCGNVIAVPAKAPIAARPAPKPAEQDMDLDGLYALAQDEKKATAHHATAVDESAGGYRCPSCSASMPPGALVCPNCHMDMRTGMRQPVRVGGGVLAAAGAYAAATPTARAGVLPYGGGGRGEAAAGGRNVDQDILYEGGKFRSLYLPLGLIVLGILFYFGQVAFSNNRLSAGVMVGLVAVRVVMDSVLIFIAMLVAVRAFDMGFGAFGPAVLKVLAIALGPGALGQMVETMLGGEIMAMMAGVIITIILYFALIKVLFNLDLGEMFLLVVLIIGVRRVLGTFLFVALIGMASSGLLSPEGAGAIGGGALAVTTAGDEKVPPKRTLSPAELAKDLDSGNQEALNYIQGGDDPRTWMESHPLHTLAGMTKDESEAFLKRLESLGAQNIRKVGEVVYKTKEGMPYGNIASIMFEMPTDPAARKQIFDIRAGLEAKAKMKPEMVQVEVGGLDDEPKKREPLKDWGQRLLEIRFAGSYAFDGSVGAEGGDDDGDDMDEGAPAPTAKPDGAAAPTPEATNPAPADATNSAPAGDAAPQPAAPEKSPAAAEPAPF